jgi:hypothetical protein
MTTNPPLFSVVGPQLSLPVPSLHPVLWAPSVAGPAAPFLVVVTGLGPDAARSVAPPHRCYVDCTGVTPMGRHRLLDSPIPMLVTAGSGPSTVRSIRRGWHLRLPPCLLGGYVSYCLCRSCVDLWQRSWVQPVPTPVAPNSVVARSTIMPL